MQIMGWENIFTFAEQRMMWNFLYIGLISVFPVSYLWRHDNTLDMELELLLQVLINSIIIYAVLTYQNHLGYS